MNNVIPPSDRFSRAVASVRAQRGIDAASSPDVLPPIKSPRARLNVFPDNSTISNLVERARDSLKRGVIWARGAIVNLVV